MRSNIASGKFHFIRDMSYSTYTVYGLLMAIWINKYYLTCCKCCLFIETLLKLYSKINAILRQTYNNYFKSYFRKFRVYYRHNLIIRYILNKHQNDCTHPWYIYDLFKVKHSLFQKNTNIFKNISSRYPRHFKLLKNNIFGKTIFFTIIF